MPKTKILKKKTNFSQKIIHSWQTNFCYFLFTLFFENSRFTKTNFNKKCRFLHRFFNENKNFDVFFLFSSIFVFEVFYVKVLVQPFFLRKSWFTVIIFFKRVFYYFQACNTQLLPKNNQFVPINKQFLAKNTQFCPKYTQLLPKNS